MALLSSPGLASFRSTPSSPNPDTATAQTVRIMCGHIREAAKDPLVWEAAGDAVRRFRGGPPLRNQSTDEAAAASDWWYAKHAIRFAHHEALIRQWLNESEQLQLLIEPGALLRMKRPEGDCAIFTMLLCALLEVQNIPWEIVTVAANPREPRLFTHVYPRAVLREGRMPLDASHGAEPGWEVPSADVSRRQVWDSSGRPVGDLANRSAGLHAYRRRHRGLGDPCFAGDPDYDPSATGCFGTVVPTTAAPSSSGGVNWSNLVASLATAWTKIGGQVVAPQTTIQTPTSLIQTPAGSSTAALATSTIAGISSTWLVIGALAIGGLVVVKSLSK